MILQLDADLSVWRLLTEECMFQQLVCVGSLSVVFDQTYTDEVHKLLRPSTFTYTWAHCMITITIMYTHTYINVQLQDAFTCSIIATKGGLGQHRTCDQEVVGLSLDQARGIKLWASFSHLCVVMARYDTIPFHTKYRDKIRYNTIRKCFTVCKNRKQAHNSAATHHWSTGHSAYQHCRRCRCLDTGRPARRRSWATGEATVGRRPVFLEVQGYSAGLLSVLAATAAIVWRPHGRRAVARLKYLVIAQSLNIWAVRNP